ncbi:hypothetical protein SCHPADRAFT_909648 [Schizopora paradoxa]|uniref:F-box domain-containing protein n=1 Tax=Schizopora paradoxa TaxID=27342 RepID=A0A0H2R7C1_9AGAM|nr:hypothetical protein SCHPADRAFT_909648 [Schizopora paradoxa]
MQLWCTDWLRTFEDASESTERKVQVAKSSLQRMKSVGKLLSTISTSLERTIEAVSNQSLWMIRVSGFSSLPDDVIARIFELYYEGYRNHVGDDYFNSCGDCRWGRSFRAANVLTQVSRRFRLIALHIPALWDCISGNTRHAEEMVPALRARCQYPNIFINYDCLKETRISTGAKFFRLLPPADQWRGLAVFHGYRKGGRKFFEDIQAISDGRLVSLLDLQISLGRDLWLLEEIEVDEDDTPTNLTESESALLAEWSFPKLKRLSLNDIIPTRMDCLTLQECRIVLGINDANWDLHSLGTFFECIPLLESLSFSFIDVIPMEPDDQMLLRLSEPVRLSCLRLLELHATGETEGAFLTNVLDLLDLRATSTLKVSLRCDSSNPDTFSACISDWLSALACTKRDGDRIFPDVRDLRLSLHGKCSECVLPYSDVMRSVPRVRNLVLNLPEISEPPFKVVFEYLKELRLIRLEDCNSFRGWNVARDLERVEPQKLKQLEKFEIEGSRGLWRYRKRLAKRLGNKLVWKE